MISRKHIGLAAVFGLALASTSAHAQTTVPVPSVPPERRQGLSRPVPFR